MRTLSALLAAVLLAAAPNAQAPNAYEFVDEPPQLVGGLEALMATVVYPEAARRAGTEGRVIVRFVVDETGQVENPAAVAAPDSLLAQAAVSAVQAARFTPGRQDGQPVRVVFALPITFRLAAPVPADTTVYSWREVDESARLVGGLAALQEAVEYPENARRRGSEGQVVVLFQVNEDGSFEDPSVRHPHDPALAEAAIAALAASSYVPARKDGRPVRSHFSAPVSFRLDGSAESEVRDESDYLGCEEQPPELIGGMEGLRVQYPESARQAGIEGRVLIQFTIDTEGRPADLILVDGIPQLNRAAIRAVERVRFVPARVCDQPIRVKFSLPITFRLRG